MENTSTPTISLIIPAYNEEKYIGDCLYHAIKNSQGKFFEIIVIDNASTDRTAQIASNYLGVRVVREDNKGLVRARQRGYIEAKGDILAFSDADTHMTAGWYDQVHRAYLKHPNLACISGPYIYYDTSRIHQFFVKAYWYTLAVPISIIFGYVVVGGNFAIKKTVLDKMNGFDTTIEFYGEDTDIGRRAHKFGRVIFDTHLIMPTSGRRFHGQGTIKTAITYVANFLSEAILHRAVTKKYSDIR